jgi:hypothetical protein
MIYKDHKNRKSIRNTLEYMFRESPEHGRKMDKVIFLHGSSTSGSPLTFDEKGKVIDVDVSELVEEFEFQTSLYKGSARDGKFYNHASLSLQANEHLSTEQWEESAKILQEELGFEYDKSLYCGVIHLDKKEQLHIHLASNRVDIDGDLISQHNNWEKAQHATKKICQKFGLEVIQSSFDELGNQNNDRTDSMKKRIAIEGDKTKPGEIKDVDVRAEIRRTIASVFKQDKPKTISDYTSSLGKRGVILKGVEGQVGECVGVKYNMPSIKDKYYSGSKISATHASWGSLLNEKRKGLGYEPFRDNPSMGLVPVMRAKIVVNTTQVRAIRRLRLNVSMRIVGRETCVDFSFCFSKQARDIAKWIALIMRLLKMLFSGSKVSFYTPLELSQSSVINKKHVECVYNAKDQQECFKHLAQDTELWRNIEDESIKMDVPLQYNHQDEEVLTLSV